MASPAQITANRVNANLSTGPADTSRTRFNGLAHGLTSKQTVVRGESQEEYEIFYANLTRQLSPGSAIENVLAERVVAAAWRLQRFTRVETSFFNNRIDAFIEANPDSDPDAAFANLFVDPAETARMRLFMRYQTGVQREYDKAFKEFRSAKAEREAMDQERLALGMEELVSSLDAPIGFASQNVPMSMSEAFPQDLTHNSLREFGLNA